MTDSTAEREETAIASQPIDWIPILIPIAVALIAPYQPVSATGWATAPEAAKTAAKAAPARSLSFIKSPFLALCVGMSRAALYQSFRS